MSLTKKDTRQSVLAVTGTIDFDTLDASGVGEALCSLPQGAVVTGGHVVVDTNWDSATSAVLDIGDSVDDDRYLVAENLLAAGDEFGDLLITGYEVINATRDILVEITYVGAPTVGSLRVVIEYVVDGRSTENFE